MAPTQRRGGWNDDTKKLKNTKLFGAAEWHSFDRKSVCDRKQWFRWLADIDFAMFSLDKFGSDGHRCYAHKPKCVIVCKHYWRVCRRIGILRNHFSLSCLSLSPLLDDSGAIIGKFVSFQWEDLCCCYRWGRSTIWLSIRMQMPFFQPHSEWPYFVWLHFHHLENDNKDFGCFSTGNQPTKCHFVCCIVERFKASKSNREENTRKFLQKSYQFMLNVTSMLVLSFCLSVCPFLHLVQHFAWSIVDHTFQAIRRCRCRSIQTNVSFSCSFNFPFGHLKIENV